MGLFGSSEERINSAGHVNTNVIIQEARDTHTQMLYGEKMYYLTLALVGFGTVKLAVFLFNAYTGRIKKLYNRDGQ